MTWPLRGLQCPGPPRTQFMAPWEGMALHCTPVFLILLTTDRSGLTLAALESFAAYFKCTCRDLVLCKGIQPPGVKASRPSALLRTPQVHHPVQWLLKSEIALRSRERFVKIQVLVQKIKGVGAEMLLFNRLPGDVRTLLPRPHTDCGVAAQGALRACAVLSPQRSGRGGCPFTSQAGPPWSGRWALTLLPGPGIRAGVTARH